MLDVTPAAAQRHDTLTIFPLIAGSPVELPFLLMSEALASGTLRISEVGSGTVPELYAVLEGDRPVLVVDGEQLIGARQNRMANRSIILPAKSRTHIPVSCMEQGRWHFRGEHFSPSVHHSPSKVRRHARQVEAMSAEQGAPPEPAVLRDAQGHVWGAIADKSAKMGIHSATGALDELYVGGTAQIEKWMAAFPRVENQVGIVTFLGDHPLGMDLIGCTRIYGQLHDRLLRGYVMDALGEREIPAEVPPQAAQDYLDRVRDARRVAAPTVGGGEYAVLGGTVVGGELKEGGRVVHLSAFPVEIESDGPGRPEGVIVDPPSSPIAPPSRRRRR